MSKRLFFLTSFVLVLSLVFNASAQPTGQIMFEYWFDIGGVNVSDLTGAAGYPDSPDSGELRDKFEGPVDWLDNYGVRVRGFLYPPEDGDYTLWISGDDFIELYLSTDDDPANAALIAEVPGWTQYLEWGKYPEQQSAPITLVAGQKYYIEALMKEAGGGDSVTAGWTGPGIGEELVVIDGAYLSPVPWNPSLLKANNPNPADGAVDVDTASLEWGAGPTAVSHKVYLSADDTIDDSDLAAETDLTIHLAVLDVGAAYYWRVDEVEADGNVIEGNLWSFTTLPLEAHFPSPADGAVEVKTGTQLEWTAGKGVIMHDVYYGTDEALVAAGDPSTFKGKVMVTSFDPGAFDAAVTYYWKIDEFSVTGTNAGPVWSFTGFDPDVASDPDPADGAGDVDNMPVLSWVAGETASSHDVYFGTDRALVEAGDASVFQGKQTEASFAPADALERGITYYWKVDINTGTERDGMFHPGKVWSLRVIDRNTNNWAATVPGDSPAYLATFVEDGVYDIGELSGDITYEFVVKSNPDETEASMALIGRKNFGDTAAGIKYEQWNNTGTYGATLFGVVDLDYGVATAPGEYTVLTFVSSEASNTTTLYVNGVNEGSVDAAITLSGLVGIGLATNNEDGTDTFDNFDGTVFGVAIFDEALSDEQIAKHSDSYFTPIAITDPDLLIHYDFESGEGLTVLDRSGHGNHALFMGNPSWETGIFGGALGIEIDELDYIQTAGTLGITTNTITVSGWVKHDETPAGWSGILTHRGTDPGSFGLQHNGMETGAAELRYMWGSDVYWNISTGLLIPNGEWYFAAIAISPDQAKFYLNGIGDGQTFTHVAEHVPTNFDSEIRVGRDHNDGRIMTSLIDEVRFYNKTLSDVEILKLIGAVSDVTGPGDVVQGVPNDGDWPGAETPDLAVDDDVSTKYLHFKGETEPSGFQVEPASGPSIVTGLTFTTANDAIERDPISFELSGSNDSIDGPYELIASGDIVDFAQETAIPRFTMNSTAITFDNDVVYKYYQVMFPTVRDAASANSMQIAEVELLGVSSSLVAHWALDDGAGTVAADSSGNGNDGTLVGDPQWVAGIVGGALEFDGVDDFVDGGNAPELAITGEITVACWMKVNLFDKSWQAIVTTGDGSWRLHRSSGSDNVAFGTSGLSDPADLTGTVNVNDAEWHHIAAVYDGTQKLLYTDGIVDVAEDASGNINASTYNVNIGENDQAQGRYFNGLIDDVRIYNQGLSPLQINALANPGAPDDGGAAELTAAFAFGSRLLDCATYNDPTVNYTMVLHDSVASVQYDAARGYGYEVIYPVDSPFGNRDGYGVLGPFDDSPNNRSRFGDECPEELYDSFIGAKSFTNEVSAATMGDMDTPGDPPEGIIFRVDVPNGSYRFVGAFGEADNHHAARILAEDGGSGPPENIGANHVVLVSNHDQAQQAIGEARTDRLGAGVFARVGFDGMIPPLGDGVAPDPQFIDMDENGMPTDAASSPILEVTQGYIRIHQLQGNSNDGPGGDRDANGGDAVILELWKVD
ncbi:MAG: LamG-like jellyroll fold domain-containing protein [Planctomycetota bacterium]|jgi:hypothetical protein